MDCVFGVVSGVVSKKSLPNPRSQRFSHESFIFSLKSFLVLALTFRSLMHFVIFVYGLS